MKFNKKTSPFAANRCRKRETFSYFAVSSGFTCASSQRSMV